MGFRDRSGWVCSRIPEGTGRLLDVGCHAGLRTEAYASRAAEVVGVDPDAEAIAAARRRRTAVVYAVGDACHLDFPDAHFDVVVCSEVLEHLPREQELPAALEMARVMRPGGRLILTTPHAGAFGWLDPMDARSRVRRLRRRLRGESRESVWGAEKGHYHYKRRELLIMLGAHYEVVEVYRSSLLLHPLNTALRHRVPLVGGVTQRLADWEYRLRCGPASYSIGIVAVRVPGPGSGAAVRIPS